MKKNYESLTFKAEALVKTHITGTRKGMPDQPNYLHSFRVRDLVNASHQQDQPDDEVSTAALLHDVVEDGGVTFDQLAEMGFSQRTIDLVRLCTHRLDVQDSTKRWLLMVAKLVTADDADAWQIKLADLTDNLTQCTGLSSQNRCFMIEVKAPLLLRLAGTSAIHTKLNHEMELQRTILQNETAVIPREKKLAQAEEITQALIDALSKTPRDEQF